ncbi:MAG: HAMP domain-containing sensor histidine kinase [Bacillota bacterium]|nr:HAMP domain-containing sensor histidine kinase [Bacillota bacterium]
MKEKKFLYDTKTIILVLFLVAILTTALSFFAPIDLSKNPMNDNTLYWELSYGVSQSLYDQENYIIKDFFNYYLKAEKEDLTAKIPVEEIYEDYYLVNFDENYVTIQTPDFERIKFYKADFGEDIYLKEISYDGTVLHKEEISKEEFYLYNPLYKHNKVYKTNYLTSDTVFRRKYGQDFKFDPLEMDFSDDYVYIVGFHDGKNLKITDTNGNWDPRSSQALSYLQDQLERNYRPINENNKIKKINFAYTIDVNSPAYINFTEKADFSSSFYLRAMFLMIFSTVIYFILAVVTSYEKARASNFYKALGKFPIELAIIGISLGLTIEVYYFETEFLKNHGMTLGQEISLAFAFAVFAIFLVGLSIYYLVYLLKDLGYRKGQADLVQNSLLARIFVFLKNLLWSPIKRLTNNLEGSKKTNVLLILVALLAIGLIGSLIFAFHFLIVFICWCILIFAMAFFLRSYYDSIVEIEDLSKKIKEGDFKSKVDEDKSRFRTLAHNLNTVSQNMDQAVENAVKSERMKTELITNVSHDLKTPLTSIINYSQLLVDEKSSQEDKDHYAKVINDKANKLKVLIENLFEVSKVSSKAIELDLVDLDFSQLVDQVLGEWEDKLAEKNIAIEFSKPADPVILKLDGNQTYRILENLLSNIYKYGLESTRLYVDLEAKDRVVLVLKNISKYPLNISPEELLERFIRGDQARNTEGSGLGLSIASSLTELQGGEFILDIDGDLFKITIKF